MADLERVTSAFTSTARSCRVMLDLDGFLVKTVYLVRLDAEFQVEDVHIESLHNRQRFIALRLE